MTNIDTEQMTTPMKRVALFLRFIKGPAVDHWVRHWTTWTMNELTTGRVPGDEYYWMQVSNMFQNAFQDTGAREHAQDKLNHLTFTPSDVDTFLAQFEMLAKDASFPIDTQNTLLLLASKLPYRMMQHIILNVKPNTFRGWADAARAFHKDNIVVQNITSLEKEGTGQ